MNNKGVISLIGMILALAVICGMAYFIMTKYFGMQSIDAQTQDVSHQAGIDSTNAKTIVDSTRTRLKALEATQVQQSQDMFNTLGTAR